MNGMEFVLNGILLMALAVVMVGLSMIKKALRRRGWGPCPEYR